MEPSRNNLIAYKMVANKIDAAIDLIKSGRTQDGVSALRDIVWQLSDWAEALDNADWLDTNRCRPTKNVSEKPIK